MPISDNRRNGTGKEMLAREIHQLYLHETPVSYLVSMGLSANAL